MAPKAKLVQAMLAALLLGAKLMFAPLRVKLFRVVGWLRADTSNVALLTDTAVLLEMVPEPLKARVPLLTTVLPV